jgi:hypothetical protein
VLRDLSATPRTTEELRNPVSSTVSGHKSWIKRTYGVELWVWEISAGIAAVSGDE